MRDVMTNGGAFSHRKLSNLSGSPEDTNTSMWTTIRINKLLDDIENDGFDIKGLHNSPFKDNDISLKRGNLPFEYTLHLLLFLCILIVNIINLQQKFVFAPFNNIFY